MEHFHHIIIGAGISGSYIGLQLLENKQTDFILLEAKGEFRGKQRSRRIFVDPQQDLPDTLELGSSVFHTQQDHLIDLLHYLGLHDHIRYMDPSAKAFYTYPGKSPDEAKRTFRHLQKKVYLHATRLSSAIHPLDTIASLAKQILTPDEFQLLQGCWPEWYEICDMNAYSVATSETYMGHWCFLEGGLEQLLQEAADRLDGYIRWFQAVERITRTSDGYLLTLIGDSQPKYRADHLYLCCNLSATDGMIFEGLPQLQSYLTLGESRASMRVYVVLRRPVILPYESYSGPAIEGGWRCKYSLQVTDRIWLISYPDGTLAHDLLGDTLTHRLVKYWVDDMNHYFNVGLTLEDVDQIVDAFWKDAFSILKPDWYQAPLRDHVQDGVLVTCLPQPYDQAWMNGHLYTIPNLLDDVETQFSNALLSKLDLATEPVLFGKYPVIRGVAVVPLVYNAGQPRMAVGKENDGVYEGRFNLFGGKVSDKAFPSVLHASRAMFVECYEEANFVIRPDIFMENLLRIYLKPIFKTGSFSMIAFLRMKDESLLDWWKETHQRRLERPYVPHKYNEMDEIQFFSFGEVETSDQVSSYAKEVVKDLKRLELDWSKSEGVPMEAFREVKFNDLGIAYVTN